MSEHSIAKAKDIYERFVRQGSEYDINISAKMKKAVKRRVNGGEFSETLFQDRSIAFCFTTRLEESGSDRNFAEYMF